MSFDTLFTDFLTDLVEESLGELIEEIIEKYYEDKIDKEYEYERIIQYVTEKIAEDSDPLRNSAKIVSTIRLLSRKKSIGRLVISYLIAKYIEERDQYMDKKFFE